MYNVPGPVINFRSQNIACIITVTYFMSLNVFGLFVLFLAFICFRIVPEWRHYITSSSPSPPLFNRLLEVVLSSYIHVITIRLSYTSTMESRLTGQRVSDSWTKPKISYTRCTRFPKVTKTLKNVTFVLSIIYIYNNIYCCSNFPYPQIFNFLTNSIQYIVSNSIKT